ncbi:hypothetical protein TrRE_jg5411 [Triparma retinervis]|uniref:Ubiquitin-like protease family profile domain-containing protein n=1 Tax=Triparma retinervis TaxID=2557542 RepID=A0A9W7DYX7_9STRA|nr:hypothetical protein TrRE_jg5411 [Triparma retinervis]
MSPVVHSQCGDHQVYEDDLSLLNLGEWLNDNLVAFFIEAVSLNSPNTYILSPSVSSFLVHQLDPDDEDYAEECAKFIRGAIPPLLEEKKMDKSVEVDLVIPINSSFSDPHAAFMQLGQGTHWSLLHLRICRSKEHNTFDLHHVHYDSSPRNSNLPTATSFLETFNQSIVAAYGHTSVNSSTEMSMSPLPTFTSSESIKQSDGWSCGWYTLFFARTVILNVSQPSFDLNKLQNEFLSYLLKYKV